MSDLLILLEHLSGRAMPRRRAPYWLAYAFAAVEEFVSDRITRRPPRAPLAGVRLVRQPMRFDNRRAREELGLNPRPIRQAIADALSWFRDQGLLEQRHRDGYGSPGRAQGLRAPGRIAGRGRISDQQGNERPT